MKGKRVWRIFSLLVFFSLVLLALSMGPLYYLSTKAMEQDRVEGNTLLLDQIRTGIDAVLETAVIMSDKICINKDLSSLATKRFYHLYNGLSESVQDIGNFERSLFDEQHYNAYDNSIQVFLSGENMIFTGKGVYHREDFPDMTMMSTIVDSGLQNGWTSPRNLPDKLSIKGGGKVLTYYRKYQVSGNQDIPALVLVNVPLEAFSHVVNQLYSGKTYDFFLTNSAGDVIVAHSERIVGATLADLLNIEFKTERLFWEQEIGGQAVLVSCRYSINKEWRYVMIQPKSEVLAPLIHLRRLAFMILCAGLLIGVILSYGISLRLYQPIRRLWMELFGKAEAEKAVSKGLPRDEYEQIRKEFRVLSEADKDRQKLISQNQGALREKFIRDILTGHQNDWAAALGLKFEHPCFRVMILDPDRMKVRTIEMTAAEGSLILYDMERTCMTCLETYQLDMQLMGVQMQERMMAILVNQRANAEEGVLIKAMEKANEVIRERTGESVTIGMGTVCHDIAKVPNSFREARMALDCRIFMGGEGVILYHEAMAEPGVDFEEGKILDMRALFLADIQAKDSEAVRDDLDQLLTVVGHIRPDAFDRVKFGIITLAQDIVKQVFLTQEQSRRLLNEFFHTYADISAAVNIHEIVERFGDLCMDMIGYIEERSAQMGAEMSDKVLAFLQMHYHEDLSLESVAERLKLHPSYLGKVIRSATSQTFPQWINSIRVKKAVELIQAGEERIHAICEKVGYTNRQSFIRAFKTVMGCTPSEYRRDGTVAHLNEVLQESHDPVEAPHRGPI